MPYSKVLGLLVASSSKAFLIVSKVLVADLPSFTQHFGKYVRFGLFAVGKSTVR